MSNEEDGFKTLLVPRPPQDMGLRGSLWVPIVHSTDYKEAYLRDAGVHHLGTLHYIVGRRATREEFEELVRSFNPKALMEMLARTANLLAHEGVEFCNANDVQRSVFNGIVTAAKKRGWPIEGAYRRRKDRKELDFPCFTFETIAALMCETIAQGFERGGLNPNAALDELSLAIGIAGDQVYSVDDEDGPVRFDDDAHRRFMRENFAIAPFLGTIHTFYHRVRRLYLIYSDALGTHDAELRRIIDECLTADIGVTSDDLMALVLPLNHFWLSNENFKTNALFKTAAIMAPALRAKMTAVLNGLSLEPAAYTERVAALKSRLNERFLRSADVLALLVQRPALRLAEGEFLLVAPQLLLRKIELAMYSAFIDKRDKDEVPFETLGSPLGHAFERYAMGLLAGRINSAVSEVILPLFMANPLKANGEEIADGIIEDPIACIVFEAKHRPLSLRALDMSDDSTQEFERWLERTFFARATGSGRSRQRNGALWQLHEAAAELLRRPQAQRPRLIVPVVVLSEDVVSTIPLYTLFDKEIATRGIFADMPEVRPFLFASVEDLEHLSTMDLPAEYPTIQSIFKRKATHPGARDMTWGRFLDEIGCRHNPKRLSDAGGDELVRKASMLFPEGQRGRYDEARDELPTTREKT